MPESSTIFVNPKKILIVEDPSHVRQRTNMGEYDMQDLRDSMDLRGLLQAIIIRPSKEADGYVLIAGERRLRTALALNWATIECKLKENLTEIECEEIELEENIRRKNLDWPEHVRAINRIHKLYRETYSGTALASSFGRWGQKDTAKKLDLSEGALSKTLAIAEAIEQHPELEKHSSVREANKAFQKLRAGGKIEDSEFLTRFKDSFLHGSWQEAFRDLEADSIDLLLLDVSEGEINTKLAEAKRTLSLIGQGFVFYKTAQFSEVITNLQNLSLQFPEEPFVWTITGEDSYQFFFWFSRAIKEPPRSVRTVYAYRRDKKSLHNLQKASGLLDALVGTCSKMGEFVVDPICFSYHLTEICISYKRQVRSYCKDRTLYDQGIMYAEEKGSRE